MSKDYEVRMHGYHEESHFHDGLEEVGFKLPNNCRSRNLLKQVLPKIPGLEIEEPEHQGGDLLVFHDNAEIVYQLDELLAHRDIENYLDGCNGNCDNGVTAEELDQIKTLINSPNNLPIK